MDLDGTKWRRVFGGFKAIPNALTTPEIPNLGSGLALGYFKMIPYGH